MSSRSHRQDLSCIPSRLMLVKSPFLLVRFVVFSLLIYMSLTALVFAAWNVGASRAAGAPVDGASALVIFTGFATSLCIAMALADAKVASFSTSTVGFECAWTGIFTVLQIAASIFVTLSGPPEFCVAKAPFSICASITILVPISWLATSLLLGYFVTILALFVAHWRVHEALWSTSIYNVVWFDDDPCAANRRTSAPQIPPLNTFGHRLSIAARRYSTSSLSRALDDVENQFPASSGREKSLPLSPNTWWGRLLPGRAGRDHPFTIRRAKVGLDPRYVPSARNGDELQVDIGVPPASRPYYRFYHQGGDGWQQRTRGESSELRFPPYAAPWVREDESVLNEDEPIPVGDRSQWVPAAQAPGPYTPQPQLRGPRPF